MLPSANDWLHVSSTRWDHCRTYQQTVLLACQLKIITAVLQQSPVMTHTSTSYLQWTSVGRPDVLCFCTFCRTTWTNSRNWSQLLGTPWSGHAVYCSWRIVRTFFCVQSTQTTEHHAGFTLTQVWVWVCRLHYIVHSVTLRKHYITCAIIMTKLLTSKLPGVRCCCFHGEERGTVHKKLLVFQGLTRTRIQNPYYCDWLIDWAWFNVCTNTV